MHQFTLREFMKEAFCKSLDKVISVEEAILFYSDGVIPSKYDFTCVYCNADFLCANLDKPKSKRIKEPYFRTQENVNHDESCAYVKQNRNYKKTPLPEGERQEHQPLCNSTTDIFFSRRPKNYGNVQAISGNDTDVPAYGRSTSSTHMAKHPTSTSIYSIHELIKKAERYKTDGSLKHRKLNVSGADRSYEETLRSIYFRKEIDPEIGDFYIGWAHTKNSINGEFIYFKLADKAIINDKAFEVTVILRRNLIDCLDKKHLDLICKLAEIQKQGFAYIYAYAKPKITSTKFVLEIDNLDMISFEKCPLFWIKDRLSPNDLWKS